MGRELVVEVLSNRTHQLVEKPEITHQNSLIDNLHTEVRPDCWILTFQQIFLR